MSQRPKFVAANTPFFDLDDLAQRFDVLEFSDYLQVRPETVYIKQLRQPLHRFGKTYHTALVEISGRCLLTPQRPSQLIVAYSQQGLTSCRFWQWVAAALNVRPLPYFAGENSFIPEKSPLRQQTSWIGSRWYDQVNTVQKATYVTFTQPATQQQVVVQVQISQKQLLRQLARVRALLVNVQQLLHHEFSQVLPSSQLQVVIPPNLPLAADLQLPALSAALLRRFIYHHHNRDIADLTAERYGDIDDILAQADYHLWPPRELTSFRRELARLGFCKRDA
uniref:Uncharacterized protein n=1 Tax=Loigolactobacillus rennini TaxID=238013 RepID=A0A1K2IA20_9LACO|nr:hypothetical protein LREN565_2181 [Loigolactobacillus rennini]